MKPRRNQKDYVLILIFIAFAFYIGLRIGTCVEVNGGEWSMEALNQASDQLFSFAPVILNQKTFFIGFALALLTWMCYETFVLQNKKNRQDTAFGSAKWNTPDFTKNLREKIFTKNWIFTETEILSKDMKVTGRNRNVAIIGRPGTGKSRYFLIPNILSANDETIIVTDPKEELLRATGNSLKKIGYDIKVLNVKSKWRSDHYNPFRYIRKLPTEAYLIDCESEEDRKEVLERLETTGGNIAEDDVMSLINTIMNATKSETIETSSGDPFWEKAEMVLLQALFYYVIFRCPEEERNMKKVLELIRLGEIDQKGHSLLGDKFNEWEQVDPENIGIKQWKHFMVSAKTPKTMSTIIMTASARLAPFNLREIERMTVDDTMELDRIGKPLDLTDKNEKRKDGKVAYFFVTNPNDKAFNFLANLMYSQIFNIIDQNAGDNGGRLAVPCNLYLDEFRQLGTIPNFLENWAYVRGLDCGITVILQSLSQFKKIYKDEWETGLDCCDYLFFLGSRSKETLEYMSTMLGKESLYKKSSGRSFGRQGSSSQNWDIYGRELGTVDELAQLPKGYGILLMSGTDPFYSKLYDLKKHPRYNELWEAWTEQKSDHNTKEWLENHDKFYDHLVQISKKSNEEILREYMEAIGIKCEVGFQMEKVTTDEEAEFQKKGYGRLIF